MRVSPNKLWKALILMRSAKQNFIYLNMWWALRTTNICDGFFCDLTLVLQTDRISNFETYLRLGRTFVLLSVS